MPKRVSLKEQPERDVFLHTVFRKAAAASEDDAVSGTDRAERRGGLRWAGATSDLTSRNGVSNTVLRGLCIRDLRWPKPHIHARRPQPRHMSRIHAGCSGVHVRYTPINADRRRILNPRWMPLIHIGCPRAIPDILGPHQTPRIHTRHPGATPEAQEPGQMLWDPCRTPQTHGVHPGVHARGSGSTWDTPDPYQNPASEHTPGLTLNAVALPSLY
ncbi:uncharacterized protein LOC113929008 [Zalophus californianus]|uniref:Uncharacterized protein LOC113929008 n=1 Tax=Zalophus californianus TaxID=9704 RepID=A0A6J2E5U7_ZALCA|nr:uncharacterized protein LOC113929008 [Zalophus californianus]XP_027461299.1 uncharacterized protein LOC113929008 [Zalophus californianus]XP_027461300.1 uncharacterized protein LOC113929008 [Zalophus californianus]